MLVEQLDMISIFVHALRICTKAGYHNIVGALPSNKIPGNTGLVFAIILYKYSQEKMPCQTDPSATKLLRSFCIIWYIFSAPTSDKYCN